MLMLKDTNSAFRSTPNDVVAMKMAVDVCNVVNDLYAAVTNHPYLPGDCALEKLNLLHPKKRPRKNPYYRKLNS